MLSQLGGETGVVNQQMQKFKHAIRLMAILMIGFTSQFPTVSISSSIMVKGGMALLYLVKGRRKQKI